MEVVNEKSTCRPTKDLQTLQSLLTSIQVDQTFKSHLKDPQIMLGICQLLIQKFPNQARDLHILMNHEDERLLTQHKPIPEYVQLKISMMSDLCESLNIPFPTHSLQNSEVGTSLSLTELFFNENSLQIFNPYDYSIGVDIGGSNVCVAVYRSSSGMIESITDNRHELNFPVKGLSYYDILKKSKANAEKYLKHQIWKVFVCLPMDASVRDRLKLRHAAVLCNLELLGTSNSPQLTAFSYGNHVKTEHSVVVCDIGAKSIDIGYFLIEQGFVEVKSIHYNDSLGITSLNTLLFHHYQKEISSHFQTLLADDPFSSSHLMTLCEKLIIHLSSHETGEMVCHSILDTLHYKKPLTRAQFEIICSSYFLQLEQWVLHIFSNDFPYTTVDEILLIGGGSQIPAMKSIFRNYLKNPTKEVTVLNDEYSGVKGAALLAAIRAQLIPSGCELSQSLLVDVATHDISLIIAEGMQSIIVSRCTPIPLVKSQLYSTTYDDQTAALIHVVEAVREDEEEQSGTSRSATIGWFIFDDLPARPRGEVKISVIIDISSSYEVKVTAEVPETGMKKSTIMSLNKSDEIPQIPVYLNQQKLFLEHCPT